MQEGIKQSMKFILPRFHKERIKRKIPIRFIFPKKSKKRGTEVKKYPLTKVRVLDGEFASLTGIQIYGEFVSIILWSSNPIGILIRSKEIQKSYKNYFDYLWKQAKNI